MKTGFSVMDAMTKNPVTISPTATVGKAAEKMKQFEIGSLLVQHGNDTVGVVTEQDIIRRVVAESKNPTQMQVKDVMSVSILSIEPQVDIYDALVLMRDNDIRHIPVIYNAELVGFLTLKDVLKIEPDLFDLIVQRFQLREEENKPVFGEPPAIPRYVEQDSHTEDELMFHTAKQSKTEQ